MARFSTRSHGPPQPFGLAGRRASTAGRRRVQPGLEQRFVGVNVADAGHDALVEQHRLEAARGRRPGVCASMPASRSNGSGPRPAADEERFQTPARPANSVALPKRRTSRKRNCRSPSSRPKIRCVWSCAAPRPAPPSTGRSCPGEDKEPSGVVQIQHDPLAAPPTASTRRPISALLPCGFPRLPQGQAAGPHVGDATADQQGPQIADDRFDFRQFRHVSPRHGCCGPNRRRLYGDPLRRHHIGSGLTGPRSPL